MRIEVFGPGCHRCSEVEKAVKSVLLELNIVADVEKVKDIAKIVDAGIMQTPGLRINGKIKCSGRIPSFTVFSTPSNKLANRVTSTVKLPASRYRLPSFDVTSQSTIFIGGAPRYIPTFEFTGFR